MVLEVYGLGLDFLQFEHPSERETLEDEKEVVDKHNQEEKEWSLHL